MSGAVLEREFEVRALQRALGDLAVGRGSVVVVDAPAGLGKTTLIRHARELATAAGFSVLSARGAELEQDFTFGVARQLFESALPRDGTARESLFTGAATATAPLFTTVDITEGSTEHPFRATSSMYLLLNGLYWLLINLAEMAPVVVLVDDMQWADSPSLRFLGFLARRVDSVAVAVIVANRAGAHHDEFSDDILTAGDVTVLEPKGLSVAAVAELVRRTLGQDADDEFCVACQAVTRGNPLFIRELLRILVAQDVRPDATAVASVQALGAGAVRRHVVARLRRQPDEVRSLARAVAILGDETDLALVARQADLPLAVTAGAAELLVRDGIFEQADPPGFVHGVVRDVVLSLIPLADRPTEHERAATILQDVGEPVARVASHLLRTTPDSNAARVGILLAAANQARKQGSPSGAAVYLRRARSEPPPPELRSEVSRLLGNCEAQHLALAGAEVHLREALSLAGSSRQRALCAYSLARFRSACGAPGEAVDLLAQAISGLSAGQGDELSTELEGELVGVARADLGRRAELLDHLASFQQRPGRSAPVADAQLSVEAMFSGKPAEDVIVLARRALAGDQLLPDRSAIWAAIHTLMVADLLEETERRLNQALDTAVRKGHLFPIALVRGYLARVAYLRGDLAQASEHVTLGAQGLLEPNLALPVLHATQVELLIEEARLAEADAVVQAGALSGGREPSTVWQLWLLGARARLRATQGDVSAALADAMTCQRLYRQWGADRMLDVPWRLRAADAHHRLGEYQRAADLVANQLRLARAFGVPRHVAVALRSAAMIAGTASEASPLLQEAVELLQGSPARLELARTLERFGAVLLDSGNRQAALQAVSRAAELAVECRASAMAEQLQVLLAGSGTRPPRLFLTGVRAFTPSERQVADLAATGLTNRQIAERLFLSEKTVEAHLSRAYRKLGVHSRTQLAIRMANAANG